MYYIYRIIPAYAGKTYAHISMRLWSQDHPRLRGENCRSFTLSWYKSRIIPAYAGKTTLPGLCTVSAEDHPRLRGENSFPQFHSRNLLGSSPLTRGKPFTAAPCRGRYRIIPAYAGKTRQMFRECAYHKDHPRLRGENSKPPILPQCYLGSSPLTRGKRGVGAEKIQSPGIIPAYAGKTFLWWGIRLAFRDHPRLRGENIQNGRKRLTTAGSSPLTRGKLFGKK